MVMTLQAMDAFIKSALSAQVAQLEGFLLDRAKPEVSVSTEHLMRPLLDNHYFNCRLWREEDQARRTDVPDAQIVASKRAIDRFNQARNDAVERLDDALLHLLAPCNASAPAHSETPGAMLDRLSILALKCHHMALQVQRSDADDNHRQQSQIRHQQLLRQRADLAQALQRTCSASAQGLLRFPVYRQFKMYNDAKYRHKPLHTAHT